MTDRRTRTGRLALAAAGAALLLGVGAKPALRPTPDLAALKAKYQRPAEVPHPENNAPSEARVALGRMLFFDPRLSGSGVIACSTCHNPGLSWADGLERAVGHGMKPLPRRTPTILNLAWAEALFWDGRAESLEEQALGPIASPDEMNLPLEALVPKLARDPGVRAALRGSVPGRGHLARTRSPRRSRASSAPSSRGARPSTRWLEGDEDADLRGGEARLRALQRARRAARPATAAGASPTTASTTSASRGEDRGRGAAARGHRGAPVRVQDADPAQRRPPRALHARRLGDGARGHDRALRPGRARAAPEPLAGDRAARARPTRSRSSSSRSCAP